MPFYCPHCARTLTNRKLKKCEWCLFPIPDELLLNDEQIKNLEKRARIEKEAHEKYMRKPPDPIYYDGV